jgi:3-oxoacyl-[acyl-carrier protein] reductase
VSSIVLITGTSKGIGKSLAEHYLVIGWTVIGCSRSTATIEHSAYTHYTLDATDEAAVVRMVRQIARGHGRIDALINNAGIAAIGFPQYADLLFGRGSFAFHNLGSFKAAD